MLGNMGGASMFCHQYFMEKSKADVECPAGTVIDGKNVRFGLISTEHEMKNFCHWKSLDAATKNHGHHNCTQFLKMEKMKSDF